MIVIPSFRLSPPGSMLQSIGWNSVSGEELLANFNAQNGSLQLTAVPQSMLAEFRKDY
jgi:hypothetical protein